MASPSRLAYTFGRFWGEGLALGVASSAGLVSAAASSLGGAAVGGTMSELGGGYGGGMSVVNHFHIDGSQDPRAVAQEVARLFGRARTLTKGSY